MQDQPKSTDMISDQEYRQALRNFSKLESENSVMQSTVSQEEEATGSNMS